MDKLPVLVAAAGAAWEARAVEQLARGGPDVVLLKRCVDLPDLLASASTGTARVALVSAALPGLDVDSVAQLHKHGLGLLLVDDSAHRDPGEQARLRRLGATTVLDPTDLDDVAAAVRAAGTVLDPDQEEHSRPEAGDEPDDPGSGPGPGTLVAVWGPGGAPGRTELASRDRPALLLDADPYGGAVAQHLGVLDEVSGLLAAARLANAGSLDAPRLRSLARAVDRLSVLTGLPRADRWAEVRPAAFADILELARGLAGHVVVDCGFSLERGPADGFEGAGPARNGMTVAAVEQADEVLVVGTADPVGLARLARGLVEAHDLAPGVRLRVVVNRGRSSLGWGEREVRDMVEQFVSPADLHFLPEDRAAADRALMAGRSLVETGDSPLRRGLAAVADAVLGEPPGRRRRRRGKGQALNSR
jgi:MinD-like ATPase involved in chromosome partitioning or flagellar assembly